MKYMVESFEEGSLADLNKAIGKFFFQNTAIEVINVSVSMGATTLHPVRYIGCVLYKYT